MLVPMMLDVTSSHRLSWHGRPHGSLTAMASQSDGLPLLSYASMVWRRRVLVLIVAFTMAIPAFAVSALQTPQYQATAQVLLGQRQLDENYNINAATLTDTQVNNLVAVLTSTQVAEQARQQGGTSDLRALGSAGSNVIILTAEDPDPQRAATTIGTYVQAFSDYLTRQDRQTLENAVAQLESRVVELQERINSVPLESRTDLLNDLATLQEQLGRVKTQQALVAPGVTVVQDPQVPQSPVSPTPVRDALLALVLGLALGISLAVLLETVRRRSDVEAEPTSSLPRPPAEPRPAGAGTATAGSTTSPEVPERNDELISAQFHTAVRQPGSTVYRPSPKPR